LLARLDTPRARSPLFPRARMSLLAQPVTGTICNYPYTAPAGHVPFIVSQCTVSYGEFIGAPYQAIRFTSIAVASLVCLVMAYRGVALYRRYRRPWSAHIRFFFASFLFSLSLVIKSYNLYSFELHGVTSLAYFVFDEVSAALVCILALNLADAWVGASMSRFDRGGFSPMLRNTLSVLIVFNFVGWEFVILAQRQVLYVIEFLQALGAVAFGAFLMFHAVTSVPRIVAVLRRDANGEMGALERNTRNREVSQRLVIKLLVFLVLGLAASLLELAKCIEIVVNHGDEFLFQNHPWIVTPELDVSTVVLDAMFLSASVATVFFFQLPARDLVREAEAQRQQQQQQPARESAMARRLNKFASRWKKQLRSDQEDMSNMVHLSNVGIDSKVFGEKSGQIAVVPANSLVSQISTGLVPDMSTDGVGGPHRSTASRQSGAL
jgi:hypothetical protein